MSMSWLDDNEDTDPSVDLAIEKLSYPQFLLKGRFSITEIADWIQFKRFRRQAVGSIR